MPTSTIFLVRHAKAGDRADWNGDDTLRPLSNPGRAQAELLADRFAGLPPARLLSSPYARCVQTLEPTAERAGMKVEPLDALAEGNPFEAVLDLLDEVPANTVLCSHGDIIPATLAALARRGCEIRTPPDWRKASTWILERNGDGHITSATAVPPPA